MYITNMGDHELEFKYNDEAPLSPVGLGYRKLFIPKPEETIINCALGVRDPINVESLKKAISNSIMIKHPRFCSLIVRDHSGKEHWRRTHVNIDDHIFVHHQTTTKNDVKVEDEDYKETAINSFLADISVSTPLRENKPLWEVHVLVGLNCVVLRVHHAIGDGNSLMSMLSACFGKSRPVSDTRSGVDSSQDKKRNNNAKKQQWRKHGVWEQVKSVWYTFEFMLRLIGSLLWIKDKVSVFSGGDGVELWPRKLVTAKFNIDDLKSIKLAIPAATINDVLLGIISSGLSNYLNIKSPKAIKRDLQLTSIIPVNLRKDSFVQEISEMMKTPNSGLYGWGNKTSMVLLPIHCSNGVMPLEHVRAMKTAMDKRKHSYCAHFTFRLANILISYFGPEVALKSTHKVRCRTTLNISNIEGPCEEIAIADNPVTFIKVNISSISHAITMIMVSYAGKANLQVMVAKDIIPDPELIVKCFQDSFLDMRNSIKMNYTMHV